MTFDLANPSQLMQALGPDLLLIVGAMVLMLWAAWRPDSNEHQRAVGKAALALVRRRQLARLAAAVPPEPGVSA